MCDSCLDDLFGLRCDETGEPKGPSPWPFIVVAVVLLVLVVLLKAHGG